MFDRRRNFVPVPSILPPGRSFRDQMKSGFSAGYGIDGQPAIKTREPAAMNHRQRQQVSIGHLPRGENPPDRDPVFPDQADVVWPEYMAVKCS